MTQRNCIICYEEYTPETCQFTPCIHGFHKECLKKSIDHEISEGKQPKCPMCKTSIVELAEGRYAPGSLFDRVVGGESIGIGVNQDELKSGIMRLGELIYENLDPNDLHNHLTTLLGDIGRLRQNVEQKIIEQKIIGDDDEFVQEFEQKIDRAFGPAARQEPREPISDQTTVQTITDEYRIRTGNIDQHTLNYVEALSKLRE